MTAHTSHLMSSCAYQLKLVNSIRASLDVQNAIFTSRLDYCNYLLAGFTVQDFTRLQRLQNATGRCVLMRPREFSATDMLCELHWLPVRKRVHYKLLLLTYKTLNGSALNTLWTSYRIIAQQERYDLLTRAFWVWDSYKDWRYSKASQNCRGTAIFFNVENHWCPRAHKVIV